MGKSEEVPKLLSLNLKTLSIIVKGLRSFIANVIVIFKKRKVSYPVENLTKDNTVFITGHAKLPTAITAEKLYEVIAIGVEIDIETGIIISSDCTLATKVGRNFFEKLTTGYCLLNGIEPLILKFENRYYGSARKAIITALKFVYDKWLTFETENKKGREAN